MFDEIIQSKLDAGVSIDDIIMELSKSLNGALKSKNGYVQSNNMRICTKALTKALDCMEDQCDMNVGFDSDIGSLVHVAIHDAHVYAYMDKIISEMHLQGEFEDAILSIVKSTEVGDEGNPFVTNDVCDNGGSDFVNVFKGEKEFGLAKSFMTFDDFDGGLMPQDVINQYESNSNIKH